MNDILTVSHLQKRFGDKEILKDVSFSVPEGCIFGFVGKNGAGKTTTMKTALGLLAPNAGEIYINGEKVKYGETKTNRLVGYLPDVPKFYGYYTPLEYLRFCGKIAGMEKTDIETRSRELLSMVGLEKANKRINGFSRGMMQRLGVAQALLHRPKLLICDEPTSALDPIGRKELLEILTSVKKETTVLFSTHILSDVERISDYVAFLNEGTIILSGSMQEIREKYKRNVLEIEVSKSSEVAGLLSAFKESSTLSENKLRIPMNEKGVREKVLSYLLENHVEFENISAGEWNLEEVFMEVVQK